MNKGTIKLKYIYYDTIAGEVIDKSYWNKGDELLYTCQKTPMKSDYSNFPERKRTKKNDLLLTRNATPYIFVPQINSIYSNVVQKIAISNKFDKKFIKYALDSGVEQLSVNGDTIPSWNMDVWNNMKIPIYDLNKQNAIANYLDNKISRINKIIDYNKKLVELMEEYKQNRIIEKINNKTSSSKFIKLKYICQMQRGSFNHRPRNDERYYNGEFPFIQTGDVANGSKYITTYSQTLNKLGYSVSRMFKKGTIAMTIAANIGDVSILTFDSCFPDSIIGFNSNNNDYLYYVLKSIKEKLEKNAIVSTQQNLNIDIVGNTVSNYEYNKVKQDEIVEYLNSICSSIDKSIKIKKQIMEKLEEYKKSLIYEAVTGKIEV